MDKADEPRRRTRLSPSDRQDSILDHAAALIMAHGLSGVTMDGVAAAADVSSALMYHYFPSRTRLLEAVLRREYAGLHAAQAIENAQANDFNDMVRRMTALSLKQSEERGLLLERLFSEPAVVAAFEEENASDRKAAVRFLARRLARAHGVTEAQAEPIVELCMGITGAAGAHMVRAGVSRESLQDLTVSMILAAIDAGVAQARG
ncbi:TetR/AcrR family transcriptional regulator [Phenylobacterium aquaticum]|uniref:TetR/AcrR family transcriptional regulator n=1 Tax=Phenylobacterium aquaticum TaxID=1763816 RepID=UPI001F5DC659|nr:TetR/AcrR family transcriptional regulator [Phenylobacterium aquaticum]MCI3131932.1 TetR/AcrR family transcriptional regulator [Phenylobacterium aquaticum]